ncbi:MAG: anaerobic ribonucleoside-triphosphate reductase activating protein [Promethearchaeota archaeon]
MKIGGLIDISTKDIPQKSAMVIFTVGCNFQCDYCHNKYLLQPNVGRDYEITELMKTIKTNVLVNGISISGGEPTLQPDLMELCKEINRIGKYISIDTNGSNPEVIKEITPYIDRVALDLKGPMNKEKMEKITGVSVDLNKIIETITFLNQQKELDFEIRTTYVGKLLSPNDFEEILIFLEDNGFTGNFVLQQYQFLEGVGEPFKKVFSKPEHDFLLNLLKPYKNRNFPFQIYLRDEIVGYCSLDEISV